MLGWDNTATEATEAEKGRHGSSRVDRETVRERASRKRENLESNGQRVARLFLTRSPWKRDVSLCQFAPLSSLKQEKRIAPSSPRTPFLLSLALAPSYTVPSFWSQIYWL